MSIYLNLKNTKRDHEKNHRIISVIYISLSLVSIVLSTFTTFLLGSKSIADIADKISLSCFLMNLISTIIISTINFLQLETKIGKHKHTVREIEDVFINHTMEEINDNSEIIQEKISMINDHRPNLCFL
jgi:hypothetical protein